MDEQTAGEAAGLLEGTERARRTMARTLGLEPGDLETAAPKVLAAMRNGVIAEVHVGRWSGRARLTHEDLGIAGLQLTDEEKAVDLARAGAPAEATARAGAGADANTSTNADAGAEADTDAAARAARLAAALRENPIPLGEKMLLPQRLLSRVNAADSRVRDALYGKALKTSWGYFVPEDAFDAFRAEFATRKAEFLALGEELARDRDTWAEEVRATYQGVGREAYRRLRRLHPDLDAREGEFVEEYAAQAVAQIPPATAIRASFAASTRFSMLPLAAMLEAELPAARAADERSRLERAVLEDARARKAEHVDEFFRSVTGQLRGLVYEATTAALASLRGKDYLGGSSSRSLSLLVEKVRQLNFTDDAELASGIKQLEALIAADPKERDVVELADVLRDLAVTSRVALSDLGFAPRSARDLGVADVPTGAQLARARRNLGEGAPDMSGVGGLPRRPRALGEAQAPQTEGSPALRLVRDDATGAGYAAAAGGL